MQYFQILFFIYLNTFKIRKKQSSVFTKTLALYFCYYKLRSTLQKHILSHNYNYNLVVEQMYNVIYILWL